jgi:hypothetical protein
METLKRGLLTGNFKSSKDIAEAVAEAKRQACVTPAEPGKATEFTSTYEQECI